MMVALQARNPVGDRRIGVAANSACQGGDLTSGWDVGAGGAGGRAGDVRVGDVFTMVLTQVLAAGVSRVSVPDGLKYVYHQ